MARLKDRYQNEIAGDLYKKNIKVEFYGYLFPVQKFDNVQQLKSMIEDALEKSCRYAQDNNMI